MDAQSVATSTDEYLNSLGMFGISLGLERMQLLMNRLGNPQNRYRTIQVVGTNGKTSTTKMIEQILTEHGIKCGSYISPHLHYFSERISINGISITRQDFLDVAAKVVEVVKQVNTELKAGDNLTQFEVVTAIGYQVFVDCGVEVAIVEAGLGGRFDATNVVDSQIQVLTNISFDHTEWLGETLAEIAAEKLAVVGNSTVLVTGKHNFEVEAVVNRFTKEFGLTLTCVKGEYSAELTAAGEFQRQNFALANSAAAHYLKDRFEQEKVIKAAKNVQIPGRQMTIARDPLTIVDGAHNVGGIDALLSSLRAEIAASSRVVGVFAALGEKDQLAMISRLAQWCDEIIFTVTKSERATAPAALLELAHQRLKGQGVELSVQADCKQALENARRSAGVEGLVLATGSLTLVAEVLTD